MFNIESSPYYFLIGNIPVIYDNTTYDMLFHHFQDSYIFPLIAPRFISYSQLLH